MRQIIIISCSIGQIHSFFQADAAGRFLDLRPGRFVYLDPVEWRRRPLLYALTPLAMFGVGVALYAWGPGPFWRAIAYLAVFHFVRQQYGWVMLYRARNGERDRVGRWLDGATVYLATIYPLVWWHAHLGDRQFAWMKKGDFLSGLPAWLADATGVVYLAALFAALLVDHYLAL